MKYRGTKELRDQLKKAVYGDRFYVYFRTPANIPDYCEYTVGLNGRIFMQRKIDPETILFRATYPSIEAAIKALKEFCTVTASKIQFVGKVLDEWTRRTEVKDD